MVDAASPAKLPDWQETFDDDEIERGRHLFAQACDFLIGAAAAEKLRGSIMAVVVGLVECLQLIGVSFSANDAVWPPGLDAARSRFGT